MHARLALLTDLSAIVAFGKGAHERSNYRDIRYNAVHTRRVVKDAIRDPDSCVYIALRGGNVCGLLIGNVSPLPFSPLLAATDMVFVAERGGDMLLDLFLKWAKRMKAVRVDLGVSDDDPGDRVGNLYQRKGLRRAGGVYYKVEVLP